MEIGHIKPRKITTEMEESYLDYAMSVIVSRALPDVRDGLKPVHRRILYSMHEIGLRPESRYKKSAAVVGDVLGKYHPHGDVAVYDSLTRMAQDFSLRYPLINGQGNFGSLDGDSAAAMRYTECKLTPQAGEMLTDIEKETVNFVPNYDGTHQEPTVLPAKLPQLLLNGAMGIAVGMATNIPPHNLGEVVDGLIHLADHPKASIDQLTQFIRGPDFPTGGAIYDVKGITQAYATGKGGIVSRAKVEIEESKTGKFQIIISEMVYQVNKATLVEKMAQLVKDKKIEGIKDIRDESDREGVRVAIYLKTDAYPRKILNKLFKLTDLQKTFHLNMLALVEGLQPKVLNLKSMLEFYLKHRQEVVTRRSKFRLTKAKERAHILKGLAKALKEINQVVKTIKLSKNREEAQANLIKKFKFTKRQAIAILEMKLQTLAGLERKKIEDELKERIKLIKELEAILKSPQKILTVIKNELREMKEKYADERRTKIFKNPVGEFAEEDLIPSEETVITVTRGGYIKRLNPATYRVQRRGGKGIIGMATREEDVVDHLLTANTFDSLLFFTNQGRVFKTKVYEIPETTRTTKGQALANFLQLSPEEKVTALVALAKTAKEGFLTMATKNGIIKKTEVSQFEQVRRSGLVALKLRKNDELKWVALTSGQDEIILATRFGQAIRFKEKDVRPMGRAAAGVSGIRLKKDDQVVRMNIVEAGQKPEERSLLVVTENGYGKRALLKFYKIQKRGGSGIKTARVTKRTGQVVSLKIISPAEEKEDLVVVSQKGQVIRIPLLSIPKMGRATQGVRIMRLGEGDMVASATRI